MLQLAALTKLDLSDAEVSDLTPLGWLAALKGLIFFRAEAPDFADAAYQSGSIKWKGQGTAIYSVGTRIKNAVESVPAKV